MGQIEERFVWWLWQTRRFDAAAARAQGFDVVFPGWFNHGAGPDFRDSLIADPRGRLKKGDVEVHVSAADWQAHHHHLDPEYQNVILHVVLDRSPLVTLTSQGRRVPILALRPLLPIALDELLAIFDDWRPHTVRCLSQVGPPERLRQTIVDAGTRRFRDKMRRTFADVEAVGADEALHRRLCESLGYSANRAAFLRLGEALPFGLLSSLGIFEAEQLLLAAAGLAEHSGLLSTYIDGSVLEPGELVTFRVRPGNSPVARLRGLARLVTMYKSGLATAITSTEPQNLWRLFVVEADTVLVGRGRADDIAVNVALPFLAAYEGVDGLAEMAKLRPPPDNRWVKTLRDHLTKSGLILRPYRAIHQQGLLALALNYCRFDHCEACPLHVMSGSAES